MKVDQIRIPADVLAELSHHPDVVAEGRALANDIAKDARGFAPSKTGNLKARGIGVEKVEDEETGILHHIVGWTKHGWYGWMAEAGGEHADPRPHLVPAAIKHGAVSGGLTS